MPYLARHGTMKPPLGAQINLAHPLGRALRFAWLFNEYPSWPPTLTAGGHLAAFIITPSTGGDAPTWTSNRDGAAVKFATTASRFRWAAPVGVTDNLPTGDCTVAVIRRKLDTTNRASSLFGSDGSRCGSHCPYNDGTVYWDYGGTSAPNRLAVAGLTFTTQVERWIFTAGALGSTIWQNGVKVASQATAVTRLASSSNIGLNDNNGAAGDLQEITFFQITAMQWSDELCRWWSAEPYAHLYGPSNLYAGGEGAMIAAASAATVSSTGSKTLTLLGVG